MKYLLLALLMAVCCTLYAKNIPAEASTLKGYVYDKNTNEPLAFSYLYVEDLNRTAVAAKDGSYVFRNIPAGTYTISITRIGYQPISRQIQVLVDEEIKADFYLESKALSGYAVEIIGNQEQATGSRMEHASTKISGNSLRKNLAGTLAETLNNLPGFDTRSMGSTPSRPVIRGLGGERITILQDGSRTGDVSSQSADHAVTVDPVAAEEIEIARGPAALKYSGNAMGGVINIVRNQIATSLPENVYGTASLQGETVNTGAAAAAQAGIPIGSLALNVDGNMRIGQDISTPIGDISNSDKLSTNNAVGLSYIRPWGYAGVAGSIYYSNYGIPPDPNGGHPNGVDIEMQKIQTDGRSEIFFEESLFKSLDINYSFKNYYHKEIESNGIIGTEFGVLTTDVSIGTKHTEFLFFESGSLGLWGEAKNYAIQGASTPDSDSYSAALYLIEEININRIHLELGTRIELNSTVPVNSNPNSQIGNIRERQFTGFAGSLTATYEFSPGWFTGVTLMKSYRPPSQEELYSEGPHLASYSFEVGNPSLESEKGFGKELFLRLKKPTLNLELAGYHNSFSSYIYSRNTGQPSVRFPSLNVYQFTGSEALLYGFEASVEFLFNKRLSASVGANYTHGQRKLTKTEQQLLGTNSNTRPLPMIPPFKSYASLNYAYKQLNASVKLTKAAEQNRTGEFEESTPGYFILDLSTQYRFQTKELLHTLSLNVNNLFNSEYYNHLSRIKDIRPEPARNISLLYRLYF
ncbi:MAG: TonB-dependent receptor [Balneolaceae bacterium]|nr:TonB-dependent receptor [Balneolaceae bacterium]